MEKGWKIKMQAKQTKYTLDGGKVMFPSALSMEAWVLHSNIRDLNYCIKNNKESFQSFHSGDKDIMNHIIQSMIDSHQRMIVEMIERGEYIGNPKNIKYE